VNHHSRNGLNSSLQVVGGRELSRARPVLPNRLTSIGVACRAPFRLWPRSSHARSRRCAPAGDLSVLAPLRTATSSRQRVFLPNVFRVFEQGSKRQMRWGSGRQTDDDYQEDSSSNESKHVRDQLPESVCRILGDPPRSSPGPVFHLRPEVQGLGFRVNQSG